MPKKSLPRVLAVSAGRAQWTLILQWGDGTVTMVDVSDYIGKFFLYRPLREATIPFNRVRVGVFGASIA